MDAIDVYHLLMPIAIVICSLNFLLGFALKPDQRSPRLNLLSTLAYTGCLIGSLMMRFSISLTSMAWLVKFSIIGFLVLFPSVLLAAICVLMRLRKNKACYKNGALQFKNSVLNIGKFFIYLMTKTIGLIVQFVLLLLSHKPNKQTRQAFDEEACHKKSPYIYNDPVFGNPPQDVFGGVDPNHE